MVKASDKDWKGIIIDGRGHLYGRLATIVAKQLLRGERICVVRCEDISISQSFMRNKYRLKNIMRKKHLTQPARGPFHHRTPSKLFQRLVRSMLPRKTTRGTEALNRLKVREGIPVPFALKKRCVCPAALRVIRLAPGRRWCRLGDLCKDIGWKHDQTVQELEAKRKHKSALRWNKKKQCDTSAQCNKNSGSSKQQLSVWKGGKMPSRLSFNDFGLSLASSSICDVWNSKTTRRQLSDASSAVGSTPGKTVGDILKVKGERFYRIKTTDFVYDAVKKMVDNNVGSLVVIDVDDDGVSGRPLGIVTERDYLRKIVLLGRSSKTTYVKDIMTSANDLISVNPSASLSECMEIMTQKRIRHIPVIDSEGNVKGMVSIGDIVRELVEEQRHEAKKLNEYIQGTY